MSYELDFGPVWSQWRTLLYGLETTIVVSLVTIVAGTVGGLVLGLFLRSAFRPLRWLVFMLVDAFRSTPPLCAVFLGYYALPMLIPVTGMNPMAAACVTLSLYLATFVADVFRGAWDQVPRGMLLAGASAGMSRRQIFWRVRLPLIIRSIVPSLSLLWIGMLKHSSLASVIGVYELSHAANTILTNSFRSLETYIVVTGIYIVMVLPFAWSLRRLEDRVRNRGLLS